MRDLQKIILHCAYTYPHMDIGAKDIERWHLEGGFSRLGYHFVIRRDGHIERGTPISQPGIHASGHNSDSIGICLAGGKSIADKPDCNFTREQWISLDVLVRRLHNLYGEHLVVMGHRDVANRECPCFDAKQWWYGGSDG